MKRIVVFMLIGTFALLPALTSRAQEENKTLEAVEFLTGFGWGKLRTQNNYQVIPLIVDFDFNLKRLTQKFNFNPAQLLQFQVEPFIFHIASPHANIETGVAFAFKFGLLPQSFKFQPYLKAAMGLDYSTLHTREQGSQFNFIEYGALGAHYFFKKNTAITLEGRFRHLSNAGIEEPNSGINSYFVVAGLAYQF